MPQENAVPAGATKSDHCLRAPAATVELREPASTRLLPLRAGWQRLKAAAAWLDDSWLRDVQRAMRRWEVEYRNELLRLRDPDAYRSRVEFAATGSTRADDLNDLWQIDASPADVMLTGGKRHSIYMCIDIYSRRTIVLVTQTPRASAVGALIRKAILAWGVPKVIKTDNGSDFTASSTTRLFEALGITIELSPPYQPKTKGDVERVIGTFQRDLAGCPGFIGHSVADRKVLENRKAFNARLGAKAEALFDVEMDLREFQNWCDSWSDQIYGHAPHESLRRKTPFEVAAAWRGTVRRIEHPEALDILLAPIPGNDGIRTVTKTGVRVDHHHYYTSAAMPGTRVLVRMDPTDMGRVLLFAEDGEAWLGAVRRGGRGCVRAGGAASTVGYPHRLRHD
ncbi:Mu transposase, C-terminal [Paracoccus solventivorans]|uniref:Mu transposase, C-terminal n=1 Tax=Paracoccus solventivorans TaxID=53463 RepID=A0A1M7EZX3_9RHOB|nr:DDE-type integrase/transposase/recombinase [Paracoccus solventivorans]SHL97087.1 Mu transposase, C-terminal [Paracoccus solventivorans]